VRRTARDRERAGENIDETRTISLDVTTASTKVAVASNRNARCPSTIAWGKVLTGSTARKQTWT